MSDTGTPIDPAAPIEQGGAVPETFIPAEPPVEGSEPVIDPVIDEPIEAKAPEAEKPKNKPWFQTRIDELTRQKHDAAREAQEAKAKLAAIESAQPEPNDPSKPVFTPEAFNDAVKAEARRLATIEAMQTRTNNWVNTGNKEYGEAGFSEMCNEVARMGAGDSPDFMALVTDPDVIPDGHKVIAAMRDNPEEAQRILAMPPVKMAAALTRFSTTAKPVDKPVSQAPKPIQTIGGTAKSSAPADNEDIKAWMAKRNETAWDRKKA